MIRKVDGLIIFIWVYLVIALPALFILYFIKISSPELSSPLNVLKTVPDFSTLLISVVTFLFVGTCLSVFRQRLTLPAIFKLFKKEQVQLVSLSLLISTILWRFLLIFDTLNFFGLIILFIFFLFFLPVSITFLNSIDLNKVKSFIFPSATKPFFLLIENLLFGLAVLLLFHVSVFALDARILEYKNQQIVLSRYPKIIDFEPKIVYYGTKVVLTGRRFGWRGNVDSNLKQSAGKVDIDLWTDTEIIFSVPLHWKEGKVEIWIEKPIESTNGKLKKVRSNKVNLHLISRDNGWDEEDDAYFKQLKTLDKKTLKINGYAPE